MNGSKSIAQGANGITSGSMASGTENAYRVDVQDSRNEIARTNTRKAFAKIAIALRNVCRPGERTMSDYISREELLEKEKYLSDWNIDLCYIDSEDVKMIPSADVRPNIHAYWIVTDTICNNRMFREFKCSSCEGLVYDTKLGIKEHKFCLRCGAIMDGEPKGEKGE